MVSSRQRLQEHRGAGALMLARTDPAGEILHQG